MGFKIIQRLINHYFVRITYFITCRLGICNNYAKFEFYIQLFLFSVIFYFLFIYANGYCNKTCNGV